MRYFLSLLVLSYMKREMEAFSLLGYSTTYYIFCTVGSCVSCQHYSYRQIFENATSKSVAIIATHFWFFHRLKYSQKTLSQKCTSCSLVWYVRFVSDEDTSPYLCVSIHASSSWHLNRVSLPGNFSRHVGKSPSRLLEWSEWWE